MKRGLATACAFAVVLLVCGCSPAAIRVYEKEDATPKVVSSEPVVGAPAGGSLCLFAWSQRTYMGMAHLLERAGFRFLTNDSYDAKDCDALALVRETGSSAFGTTEVDVYAPYGGEKIIQVRAEGVWGPVWGFERAGRYIQSQLWSGKELRKNLDAARAEEYLLTPAEIAEIAGPAALTWDLVMSWEADPAVLAHLAGLRAAAAVKPARPAAIRPPSPVAADEEEEAPSFDLDELPAPRAARKAHAVVIGIERYRENLPKADFAAGDAKLAAEYFNRVLGVPEANLALLTDDRATKSDFEKYFERWLPNRVEAGDEVFVYFSGHGAPNAKTGDAYLVPYDADPTYIEQTGYSIKRMYKQLGKLPAKRVLIAMDSCFSGAGGRSVLAKGARPLVNVIQSEVPANITVIAASAGDQISNSYQEKGHGLFTYFFLKGLKEKGSDMKGVFDYLKPEVSRVARREYNADQDPQWRQGR